MVVAGAACSQNSTDAPPPTITPAAAADSPAVTQPLPGDVRPLGPGLTSVFDTGTRTLAVLTRDAAGHTALTAFGPAGQPRTVPLPAPATALAGDGQGTVYASTRGGYLRVDLADGAVAQFPVDDAADVDFTAITQRSDGTVVLGSADGAVYTLASPTSEAPTEAPADATAVTARLQIFARVDALAAQGDTVIVLDRGQTSVTSVDPSGTKAEHALRAGEGATTIAPDPEGRVLVADTRGEALLVYGTDPLMLRQRYPVGGAPYGLAGSAELAWVSQTATNSVVGYDLATGIPVEKVRYPTVQQPNSLAFDDESDTLYVVSGSGGGVQVITGATR
jgi:DNA-binding beta-propeller fold protein YncE